MRIESFITDEIQRHFNVHISSGREDPPLFFLYMVGIIKSVRVLIIIVYPQIAVTNNCKSCIEFSEQLKVRNN